MKIFSQIISEELSLPKDAVEATLKLLDEGCTIPFISRYRKERTGGMDEVQVANVSNRLEQLLVIANRKETIKRTIAEQQKLTPELNKRIDECWKSTDLEDMYLPYKPKRRTRAMAAREKGLEPLAAIIREGRKDPDEAVLQFVDGQLSVEEALQGAKDILAEDFSEDIHARNTIRRLYNKEAMVVCNVVKSKKDTDEAQKYSSYFDWKEALRRCQSNRLLAMLRGEADGLLRLHISIDDDYAVRRLRDLLPVTRAGSRAGRRCRQLLEESVEDSYSRLLQPQIETEFRAASKQKADTEAIAVFAENLRQLLLSAPLGQKRVMGIDPGFRTGCKVVCLDSQGQLLHNEAIFPHPPVNHRMQAQMHLFQMFEKYGVEAIAIGNGTASRETKEFVNDILREYRKEDSSRQLPRVFVVSEDGASVYSASQAARDEFPDHDVTVRGAVSIGRRLMDPLAELVKIDPKSIGVGQYQHDVDQKMLKHQLDQTVESCVNMVGVNLNTASSHLLTYVSGLGPSLAQNIIKFRTAHGPFNSRAELMKVPRLGPSAYQQCAGFLRIPGADNPLDNTAVHPESYSVVEQMASDMHCSVRQLTIDSELRNRIDLHRYVSGDVGLPTLTDIMKELEKPGRDPRAEVEEFDFDHRVQSIDDLSEGMVLPGIVTNITQFGAFVDIGVHQDGLVHVSQMANHFVSDPTREVRLHQHVTVRVIGVDLRRQRISLSMKDV